MELNFETLWDSGLWRKIGRREAATRFHRQIKTDEQWKDICAARDEYNNYCMTNKWYTPVLGSVWFGARKGWRSWIPDKERTEALEDDPLPEFQHKHYCAGFYCAGPHEWTHMEDDSCGMGRDVICDAGFEKFKERKARQKRVETAV